MSVELVSAVRLYTLPELITMGVDRGYGQESALKKLHQNYREWRILDKPVRKEARRGGGGLWNQAHARMWIEFLRRRQLGESPRTFSALPLAFWAWGATGVSLEWARSSFRFYFRPYLEGRLEPSPGNRHSPRHRETVRLAARLSHRSSPTRKLIKVLRDIDRRAIGIEPNRSRKDKAGRYHVIAPSLPIESLVINAFESDSERPQDESARVAHGVWMNAHFRILTLVRQDLVFSERAVPLWEWARETLRRTWQQYSIGGASIVPTDLLSTRFGDPDGMMLTFLEDAPWSLLTIIGIGLDPLSAGPDGWPKDLPYPPDAT